jgi:S1-C subfamily serine protease
MTTLDVLIALFVFLVVLRGAHTGLLAGVFSLVGVVLGAALGSRLAPLLLPGGESPIFGAGITLISILAFAAFGEVVARAAGGALRARLSSPTSETLDGLGGAALGLALSLVVVWAVGLFALKTPPLAGLHPAVEESRILQALNDRMPSELLTQAVAELQPLPQIRGPEPDVADPNERTARDPEVLAASSRTVRVSSIACGYGVEGSGWVAAPNLVVTNAHVVAGASVTRVQLGSTGPRLRAEVVLFDAKNDVAILRAAGLGLDPMPLGTPRFGEVTAVLGFPENGPLDIEPARTGTTRRVISGDAYNRGPVQRTVTSFRVYVRPGNSGGPVVNGDGEVVATVFASRAGSSDSGYGIPSRIVERRLLAAAERIEPVSTGACAN